MKIKTYDLQGAALDWLAGMCDSRTIVHDGVAYWVSDDRGCAPIGPAWKSGGKLCGYSPSTMHAHGGPILSEKGISITGTDFPWFECESGWYGHKGDLYMHGPTPLIAGLRCLIASEYGDEVEVPDELLALPASNS